MSEFTGRSIIRSYVTVGFDSVTEQPFVVKTHSVWLFWRLPDGFSRIPLGGRPGDAPCNWSVSKNWTM